MAEQGAPGGQEAEPGILAANVRAWARVETTLGHGGTYKNLVYPACTPVDNPENRRANPGTKDGHLVFIFGGRRLARKTTTSRLTDFIIGPASKPGRIALKDGFKHLQPALDELAPKLEARRA